MIVEVKKWGNSQGIRIPKDILRSIDADVDEQLEIEVVDNKIIIYKANRHKSLETRIAAYSGKLSIAKERKWTEVKGDERW